MTDEYIPQTDFSEDEADLVGGRSEVRTEGLDVEFSAIANAIRTLIGELSQVRRSDGALRDGVVGVAALSAAVLALFSSANFTVRGTWVTATDYAAGDLVGRPTGTYLALAGHTSGVFATDYAAGLWTPLFDTTTLSAAGITFTPAGTIAAANAQAAIEEAAAEALQKASNLSDLASVPTARTNLGVFSKAEIQVASGVYVIATGTPDALVAAPSPAIAALVDGLTLIVQVPGANTVTAPTVDVSGLGAKTITRAGGAALNPGDMAGAAARAIVSYHATGDYFELLNPQASGSGASGADINSLAGDVLTLPVFGDQFDLTVSGTVNSITTRPAGSRVSIKTVAGGVVFTHSTSLQMRHAATSTLTPNEVIEFISEGGGVWSEMSRRDLPSRERVAFRLSLSQLSR